MDEDRGRLLICRTGARAKSAWSLVVSCREPKREWRATQRNKCERGRTKKAVVPVKEKGLLNGMRLSTSTLNRCVWPVAIRWYGSRRFLLGVEPKNPLLLALPKLAELALGPRLPPRSETLDAAGEKGDDAGSSSLT